MSVYNIAMNLFIRILKSTVTKVVLVLCVLLLLVCIFFFYGWFEKQVNKGFGFYYVYKGDKAYRRGQLEEAIRLYRKGLDKYPEHSLARCNLGNIYVKYEDFESAVLEYDKALQYNPKLIVCRMNMGIVAAEKLADYDMAIREYQTILETRRFTMYIPLIFNSVRSTKDNKTIAWYNMGIAYRGKSLLMGEKTYASNQYLKKSVECYKKALKRHKKSYDINYNYAIANHLLGNYKEAGLGYCRAIEIDPMSFDAHYNLALLLKHIKKYRESIEELEKAALLVDNTHDPYVARYMFNVMSTVTEKYYAQNENEDGTHTNHGILPDEMLKEGARTPHIVSDRIEDENDPLGRGSITYINGKVVATEEAEKYLRKNFGKCTGKKIFEGEEEFR